jgi:hypothetical protein
MSEPWRWRDVEVLARWVAAAPELSNALRMLHRMPFLSTRALGYLGEHPSGPTPMRDLLSLEARALIAPLYSHGYSGSAATIWHLTDRGLGTLTMLEGLASQPPSREHHTYAALLRRLLPQLPQLQACYELLCSLTAPGPTQVLDWERPWRRRWHRPWTKAPVAVSLPAFVEVQQRSTRVPTLLLPDLGRVPVRCYRPMLMRLLAFRAAGHEPCPALLIAAPRVRRVEAWETILDEVCAAGRDAPLAARIVLWHALPGDPRHPSRATAIAIPGMQNGGDRLKARTRPTPAGRGSGLIGKCLPTAMPLSLTPSLAALALRPAEWRFLDLLGRHPFLSWTQLCTVAGRSIAAAEPHLRRLASLQLVHSVDDEGAQELGRRWLRPDEDPLRVPLEVSTVGLETIAAHQGVSRAQAVRFNGLAGGGPQRPMGDRQQLVRTLLHTLGANQVFVSLYHTARTQQLDGRDDAVLEWRNAAACARGAARPDAYGLYRREGRLYGFFLEYDRGTEDLRDYLRKFNAYYHYWLTERYRADYTSLPTILVVTTSTTAEERIARAVRLAAQGRHAPLPILVTAPSSGDDSPQEVAWLEPIWWNPNRAGTPRRRWIEPAG